MRAKTASIFAVLGLVAATGAGLALAGGNSAAARQASGALQLKAVFIYPPSGRGAFPCPSGAPATAKCFQFSGSAAIPGLGAATDSYQLTTADDNVPCVPLSFTPDVITVGSKGEIDASITTSAPCNGEPTGFTITGGTGVFAGASGGGTLKATIAEQDDREVDLDDPSEWTQNVVTGTLTVPGATFDVTPPVISGAHAKTVRVAKTASFAHVTYTVSARDDTDATVPVTCKPRSGSRFKVGRTTVHCSATDSSANTATAKFVVTVKRR
jgi:hypothetical protein